MDTRTGEIVPMDEVQTRPLNERGFFKPIKRELTQGELSSGFIRPKSPCGCGSGKKFRKCCKYKKD